MRAINFSAGPAVLPEDVLKKARNQLLTYKDSGMSVMEMSHRSDDFQAIIDKAEGDLRTLMGIPDNYKVLFLQGGASMQFAMVPLNLMTQHKKAIYIKTGEWSKKAISEGKKYGEVIVAASSEDRNFAYIPKMDANMFDIDADYVHITQNNTIYGTKYNKLPEIGDKVLVSDMSSCILSEEINVNDFGIIYAGAQKNIGPAGLTIVIIRDDLIGRASSSVPTMLDYKTHADAASMYNTPPTYGIYIAGLVFEYLLENGGVPAMNRINVVKAAKLYHFLDNSAMFSGTVDKEDRSLMNVPFVTGNDALDKKFIAQAQERGIVNIQGHRSVGGMRASIYNAMPMSGVDTLIDFMTEFESNNI